jgi:hypothetical protein
LKNFVGDQKYLWAPAPTLRVSKETMIKQRDNGSHAQLIAVFRYN